MKNKGVLFDLDGTLFDTAPNIAHAVNLVLKKYNRASISPAGIRSAVAKGTTAILQYAFSIDEQHTFFSELRDELLSVYKACLTHHTYFFEGMETVLDYLDQQKIIWGIVTNRLSWLAQPLLAHFKLEHRCCCLVAGDTLLQRKPHPAPLLHACQLANITPEHSIYVGDTEEDMQAARAANMFAVAAAYGYHDKNHPPEQWVKDAIIKTPHELINYIT